MADFGEAYTLSMGHEGGYVHDPLDPGGETWRGISRRWNPDWKGWDYIDEVKDGTGKLTGDMLKTLRQSATMILAARKLYRQKYWDVFWGDSIPNQLLANELFDTGINLDPYEGVRYLQEALNRLNYDMGDAPMPGSRRPYLYADLLADGKMGPTTMGALRSFLAMEKGDASLLLLDMNVSQWVKYRQHPNFEGYARGFAQRAMLPGKAEA